MRMSKMYMPTLKETPGDAEVASHKFLLRAGMIKNLHLEFILIFHLDLGLLKKLKKLLGKRWIILEHRRY